MEVPSELTETGFYHPYRCSKKERKKEEKVKTERLFISCESPFTGEIFVDEVEAEFTFEINGFRFFYHDKRITDALTGMRVVGWRDQLESTKEEFINRAREKMIELFPKYLEQVKKKKKRVNWAATRTAIYL